MYHHHASSRLALYIVSSSSSMYYMSLFSLLLTHTQASLQAGLDTPSSSEVEIKLIAPPMYVVTTMTLEKDLGIEALTRVIESIR